MDGAFSCKQTRTVIVQLFQSKTCACASCGCFYLGSDFNPVMSTLLTFRDTPTNSKPLSQSLRIEAAFPMGMDGLQSARGMSVEQARAGGVAGGAGFQLLALHQPSKFPDTVSRNTSSRGHSNTPRSAAMGDNSGSLARVQPCLQVVCAGLFCLPGKNRTSWFEQVFAERKVSFDSGQETTLSASA